MEFDRKPLKVTPDSALSFLKPGNRAFDKMLLRFVDDHVRKGTVVWDVGANVGVFSLAAAARGGDVLAIEADPWLYTLLSATSRHRENRDLALTPLCVAVASKPGVARLQIAVRGRSASYLEGAFGSTQTGGIREEVLVPVLNLDTLLGYRSAPDVVKIDIEGGELALMKGASVLVREVRPIFLVEVQSATRENVLGLLESENYRVSDYETGAPYEGEPSEGANFLARPN